MGIFQFDLWVPVKGRHWESLIVLHLHWRHLLNSVLFSTFFEWQCDWVMLTFWKTIFILVNLIRQFALQFLSCWMLYDWIHCLIVIIIIICLTVFTQVFCIVCYKKIYMFFVVTEREYKVTGLAFLSLSFVTFWISPSNWNQMQTST